MVESSEIFDAIDHHDIQKLETLCSACPDLSSVKDAVRILRSFLSCVS